MNYATEVKRNKDGKPISCDLEAPNGVTLTFALVKDEVKVISRSSHSHRLESYDQLSVPKNIYYEMLKQAMGILKGKE